MLFFNSVFMTNHQYSLANAYMHSKNYTHCPILYLTSMLLKYENPFPNYSNRELSSIYLHICDRIRPLERESLILLTVLITGLWHHCDTHDQVIGEEESACFTLAYKSTLVELLWPKVTIRISETLAAEKQWVLNVQYDNLWSIFMTLMTWQNVIHAG